MMAILLSYLSNRGVV